MAFRTFSLPNVSITASEGISSHSDKRARQENCVFIAAKEKVNCQLECRFHMLAPATMLPYFFRIYVKSFWFRKRKFQNLLICLVVKEFKSSVPPI